VHRRYREDECVEIRWKEVLGVMLKYGELCNLVLDSEFRMGRCA
jgi:hypothetical protein